MAGSSFDNISTYVQYQTLHDRESSINEVLRTNTYHFSSGPISSSLLRSLDSEIELFSLDTRKEIFLSRGDFFTGPGVGI